MGEVVAEHAARMKGFVGALTVLAFLAFCALPFDATAAHSVPTLTVRVTIHGHPMGNPELRGVVSYVPDKTKAGTLVTFKITNTDNTFHAFEIDGVISRFLGPHAGKGIIKVLFKKRGTYLGLCPDDHATGIGGEFIVH